MERPSGSIARNRVRIMRETRSAYRFWPTRRKQMRIIMKSWRQQEETRPRRLLTLLKKVQRPKGRQQKRRLLLKRRRRRRRRPEKRELQQNARRTRQPHIALTIGNVLAGCKSLPRKLCAPV